MVSEGALTDKLFPMRDGRHIAIRHASPDDAEAVIHAIDAVSREKRWFLADAFDISPDDERERIAGLGPSVGALVLALDGDEVVGWVWANRGRGDCLSHTVGLGMGVLAQYRGIGVGAALLREAIAWARGIGAEKAWLEVRGKNEQAIRLYRRIGFVEEGRKARQIRTPEGYDDIVMMGRFL